MLSISLIFTKNQARHAYKNINNAFVLQQNLNGPWYVGITTVPPAG